MHKFIILDIKDFHPSIQEELLNKGLRFTQKYMDVTSKDKEIIYQARKSLLLKTEGGLFNVTMEACAEVYELTGTYMLSLISEKYISDFIVMTV